MEVGRLIRSVEHRKAHMVISIKPFGGMPSSGVSDGVSHSSRRATPKRSSRRSKPQATVK
jgi:predicted nucleotide-binding protein (sugar kinase/HSP70/actin superfamily)